MSKVRDDQMESISSEMLGNSDEEDIPPKKLEEHLIENKNRKFVVKIQIFIQLESTINTGKYYSIQLHCAQ